jgi:hypothetical protein
MATIAVDTYKVIKRLQERGFSKEQAEALVSVVQEVDISTFVTKSDLAALEVRLYKFLFAAMSAQTALIVGLLQLLK